MSKRYRKDIQKCVQYKLWAECMGRCMNPDCPIDLFFDDCRNIAEKAHIHSYHSSQDNSFENLVILCPNCHKKFDKTISFTKEIIISWKKKRAEEVSQIFAQKFDNFEKLEEVVKPILEENKSIYDHYFLGNNPNLWEKFEENILLNNQKLRIFLTQNRDLFQQHPNESYSNLAIIDKLVLHIDEFYSTRECEEKIREVLFPKEVNSIFGIEETNEFLLPSSESLEYLIKKLQDSNSFIELSLDTDSPYIKFNKNGKVETLHLKDIYRLRQIYHEYKCFRAVGLRLESLTFILKWLKNNNIDYRFLDVTNLAEIKINNKLFKFVYEYCLGKENLISLAPKKGIIICNLHNFNGEKCISQEARDQAAIMNIGILTQEEFYGYFTKK